MGLIYFFFHTMNRVISPCLEPYLDTLYGSKGLKNVKSLPDCRLIERTCVCGHSNEGAGWLETTSSRSTSRCNPQQRSIARSISQYDAGRMRHAFTETVTAVRRNFVIYNEIFRLSRWSPGRSVFIFVFIDHVENIHSQKIFSLGQRRRYRRFCR